MAKITIIVLFIAVAVCVFQAHARSALNDDQSAPCAPCAVPFVLRPVCGTNGRTYNNKEEMECDNKCKRIEVKISHEGPCS